jgi:hypothetical protein
MNIVKTLRKFLARRIGYQVLAVSYSARTGKFVKTVHYCFSWNEAMAWASCYPKHWAIGVREWGKYAAVRDTDFSCELAA